MKKNYLYLTYAGAIPFVFCAVCLSSDIQQLPFLGSFEKIISVYALVICSFLAGSHWGQHLNVKGIWSSVLTIVSNIIAILLWFCFLVLGFKALIAVFVSVFIILLFVDHRLFQSDLITRQYFQTRFFVSAIVIFSLIISGTVS